MFHSPKVLLGLACIDEDYTHEHAKLSKYALFQIKQKVR